MRTLQIGAALLVASVVAGGCTEGVMPTASSPDGSPDEASLAMGAMAVQKEPISGSLVHVGEEPPGGVLVTPSGRCHLSDVHGHAEFTGDIEGAVTFRRRVLNSSTCGAPPEGPGDRITGAGPVDGVVTYDDRTGEIAGQWTTECRPDASQPTGFSCDGTLNLRGSGDLEGVRFHVKWGPGWWPFPYEGTASG